MLYEPFASIGARGFEGFSLEKVRSVALNERVSVAVKEGESFHKKGRFTCSKLLRLLFFFGFHADESKR